MGVVVSDTTMEIRIATVSVTANSRNRRPTMPPISRIGMNTAISDRLIETTVKPTSLAPCSAALIRGMPASMCREMFSSTMMASSTTKPAAIAIAISDRLLRLKPSRYMPPKVPISDTGTATAATKPARADRRNAKVTSTTRMTLAISACSTSRSEARMVIVRSLTTCRSTSLGSAACNSGRTALIWSTVSMTLALGCR